MLPSVESLRCFLAAARLLNFRAAAKSVALTPAAFGQRIKGLEDQLGCALFQRSTRSVRLTQEGLRLRPVAERCVVAATECLDLAGGAPHAGGALDVVLGTRHELGLSWILPQLAPLAEAHPTWTVHLYFGSGRDLLLRVRGMEIDCAVTSSRHDDPRLESIVLHREDYAFVAAPSLLAERPLSRAEHAASHFLLDTDEALPLFRYFQDAAGAPARLSFRRVVRLGTIEAIRRRTLDGAGVSVLPTYLIGEDLKKKRLVPVFRRIKPLHDYFRLVFRADDPRRATYDELAAYLLRTPLR